MSNIDYRNSTISMSLGKNKLVMIIAIIFICYSLSGVNSNNYMYISFFMLCTWILVVFLTDNSSFIGVLNKKKIIAFWFYITFFILTSIFSSTILDTFKNIAAAVILFSPMFILSYYLETKQIDNLYKIVIFTGFFWFFIAIRALQFYKLYPNAARVMASRPEVYGKIAIGGGYGLAYGSVIITVYLFDLLINGVIKKSYYKFLFLITITTLSFLVIQSRSTITILCLFIGLIISFVLKIIKVLLPRQTIKSIIFLRRIISLFIFFIFILIILIFYKKIGIFIIEKTLNSENIILNRIRQIGIALVYNNNGFNDTDDLFTRFNLLLKSYDTFLDNPIIGSGYKYGYAFELSGEYIGNHSEWLDVFGRMGLLGGIPFILIFYYSVKIERIQMNKYIPATYVVVLFLLGLFNPFITFQSLFALFFLIPAIAFLIKQKLIKMELIHNS
jgi:hypothetical protein